MDGQIEFTIAPMPTPAATSPDTSGDEIAVAYGTVDITRQYLQPDGTLQNEDVIFQLTCGGDLRQYEDILRDDQVASTFEQRRAAVTSANWSVEAGADDAQSVAAAEVLECNLKRIGWDRVTDLMLYTRFFGWGVTEFVWGVFDEKTKEGAPLGLKFGWSKAKVRDRKRFLFQADGRCYLNTGAGRTSIQSRIYAEAPYFWVANAGGHHSDMYYGLGLAHQLYWLVRFKRDGIRFWMVYLEKFGMPTAVGKYKPGSLAEQKNKLLGAIRAIQTQAGVIIPDDMLIELLEAKRSGNTDYSNLANYIDRAISKVCIGQTLTTDVADSGSRALGQVHEGVAARLVKADSDMLGDGFNEGPARWLTDFNFSGAEYPRVKRETEDKLDLTALAAQLVQLYSMGFKPSLEMVQQNWGADMEIDEDHGANQIAAAVPGVFGRPQQPAANDAQLVAKFTAATRALFPDQKALDGSVEQFEARLAKISRDTLAPILAYAQTHTPAQMWMVIRTQRPDWSTEHIADAMARVLFVAKTWGRVNGINRA